MNLAVTEAKEFSSIPLKVTLNEYIEISKFYSTPKSNGFINGILDKIFIELKKEGEIKIRKATSDSIIATLDIEIADDDYSTQTGLMYRKSMEDDQAMLFIFEEEIPRAFYMKNTQFALDIIFINGLTTKKFLFFFYISKLMHTTVHSSS